MGNGPPIRIEDNPLIEGEFWFEGTQLNWKDTTAVPPGEICSESGIYEDQLLANGNLKFVEIEDECRERVSFLVEPVLPTEFELIR